MLEQQRYYLSILLNNKANKIVSKLKKYLQKGTYKITPDFCCIYNTKYENYKGINTYMDIAQKSNILRRKISEHVCKKNILVNEDSANFEGNFILISSSRKKYKIFDTSKEKILTKFIDKNEYDKNKHNYLRISEILKFPKVNVFNDDDNIIIEEYIKNVREINVEQLFINILDKYVERASLFEKKQINIFSNKLNKYKIFKDIYLKIKENTKDVLGILCHGDLWQYNIICDSREMFFIDLDEVNHYSFIYDIFFFMFTEEYLLKNNMLLSNYFNGNYDNMFKKFFQNIGQTYIKENKKQYLLFFIYEYACNKWEKLTKRAIKNEIAKIKEFIKKYELM